MLPRGHECKYSNWTCRAAAASALRSMVDGEQVRCELMNTESFGGTVVRCRVGGKN
jgi:hypothetical protein